MQVEEPIYVFQPKNIQKMEILILSTLEWKMNLVTPFSFLDYLARRLGLNEHLCRDFLTRCERLILSVVTGNQNLKIPSFFPLFFKKIKILIVYSIKFRQQIHGVSAFDNGDCCNGACDSQH